MEKHTDKICANCHKDTSIKTVEEIFFIDDEPLSQFGLCEKCMSVYQGNESDFVKNMLLNNLAISLGQS